NSHFHSFPTRRSSDLRKAGIVGVKEDTPIGSRPRAIEVHSVSVDRLHIPNLAYWHNKVISEIGVELGKVGKCCRHRGIDPRVVRSEEHTSELQSRFDL